MSPYRDTLKRLKQAYHAICKSKYYETLDTDLCQKINNAKHDLGVALQTAKERQSKSAKLRNAMDGEG